MKIFLKRLWCGYIKTIKRLSIDIIREWLVKKLNQRSWEWNGGYEANRRLINN